MGLQVGGTLTVDSSGTLAVAGGPLATSALQVEGVLNGSSGSLSADSVVVYGGGTFTQAGMSISSSSVEVAGTFLAQSGAFSATSILVDAGGTFTQSGVSVSPTSIEVAGIYDFHGGSMSTSTLTVDSGGTFLDTTGQSISATGSADAAGELDLDDRATLSAPTMSVLSGGVVAVGNATVSASTLAVANGGEVQLTNPASSRLQIPTVTNDGLIDGSGRISGTVTNNSDGEVSAATAQTLVISGSGNSNAGLISLAGGTIHFAHDLSNQSGALIAGFGTLRVDGGLVNDGTISLAGSAAVFAGVTSNSDGIIHLTGTQPNVFFDAVENNGALNVDGGASGTFYATYGGSGPILDNGALDFAVSSSTGVISGTGIITIGSDTAPAVVTFDAVHAINAQSAVALSGGSRLDLTDNTLVLNATTPGHDAASILAELIAGYNHGAWNGDGIASSLAAGNSNTALGYAISGSTFTIKYTYYGDANLDGVVNGSDYTLIDNGFNNALTAWHNGDFNYDGVVNGDDYTLIDNAFNTQGPSLASEPAEMIGVNTSQIAVGSASVPEPGSVALLGWAAFGLIRRRRRGRPLASVRVR